MTELTAQTEVTEEMNGLKMLVDANEEDLTQAKLLAQEVMRIVKDYINDPKAANFTSEELIKQLNGSIKTILTFNVRIKIVKKANKDSDKNVSERILNIENIVANLLGDLEKFKACLELPFVPIDKQLMRSSFISRNLLPHSRGRVSNN